MGKGSKPTIGFWYSMTVQFGLGYGPADELLEIRAGDRTAWAGSQAASGSFYINKPGLFGGEKKEGGIQGNFTLMMGEDTQAPNADLVTLRGAPQPAYRGLMTGIFDGKLAALNPYVKAWAFKARFLTAGWRTAVWQPSLCGIAWADGMMINPAHFIYRLWVEELGWNPADDIDLTRHQAAAQTLYDEGMGICIKWSRSDGINNTIANICNHIGAMISEDPTTGKRFLKLIRDDYDPATIPVIDKSTIIELKEYEQPALHGSVNKVTGTYQNVKTNKPGSVTAQNPANQQAQGAVVGKSTDYSLFPNADLCGRAVERDCNIQSSLLAAGKVRVKIPANPVLRGDVMLFEYTFGPWSVSMPVRILEIDEGTLTDNSIVLKFGQDQFGVPATSYVLNTGGGWVAPALDPVPITTELAFEASYRDLATRLSNADLAALDVDAAYLGTLGLRPQSVAYNYTLLTKLSTESAYDEVGSGDFAPTGTLQAGMPQEAGPTAVVLNNGDALDLVALGGEAVIDDGGGQLELCRVDAIDPVTGAVTLARGCVDTVPTAHAAGVRVYFSDHYTGVDPTEYVTGEVVQAKLLTRTGAGELLEADASAISATMAQRQARPYPPGGLLINGNAYPANVYGALTIAWSHRDRVIQNDQLVDTAAASVGPEAGTTYTVRVYLGGVLDSTTSGISGNSLSPSVGGYGTVRVEVESVLGGLTSLQHIDATFNYVQPITIAETSVSIPSGGTGSTQLHASGGVSPLAWSSAALPSGFSLASDGVLSYDGTQANGASVISFTVTDADGNNTSQDITLNVQTLYRYARLYITGTGRILISELEFRGSVGGADLTNPSTAASDGSANTYGYSSGPADPFDDNTATYGDNYPSTLPYWIQWDFGASPQALAEVAMTNNSGSPTNMPTDFELQGSNDGAAWTTIVSVAGESWSGATFPTTRTYS